MRLTAMTDFALRLLMTVAAEPERRFTIAEIAQHHGLSEAHLMKVTHALGRAGWLRTLRGKGGGISLGKAPETIRIGDVVRHVEADLRLVECRGPGSRCRLTGCCRLAGVLDDALQAFMARLDAVTLADLLPASPPASTQRIHPLRRSPAARTPAG